MQLLKSVYLASFVGLSAFVGLTGANASDMQGLSAEPVKYVKICSAYGNGFFTIPGTDACLKISGYVRAEYQGNKTYRKRDDFSSFLARGALEIDARENTRYGLVRAFIRSEFTRSTGVFQGWDGPKDQENSAATAKAFIQFYTGKTGFFTGGYATSFFDFYQSPSLFSILGSDASVTLLAYTMTFGGGISATLSIENDSDRHKMVGPSGYAVGVLRDPVTNAVLTPPGVPLSYGGQKIPAIVANLRIDQSWGSGQVSGVFHRLHLQNTYIPAGGTSTFVKSENGWAVQGGVKLTNLLGPKNALFLNGAYGVGSTSYVIGAATGSVSAGGAGQFAILADGYVNSLTGKVNLSRSWAVSTSFEHSFTDKFSAAIFGGYGNVSYKGDGNVAGVTAATGITPASTNARLGYVDFNVLQVGTNVKWHPVKNVLLSPEVLYTKINPKTGLLANSGIQDNTVPNVYQLKKSVDNIAVRLRFQRDF